LNSVALSFIFSGLEYRQDIHGVIIKLTHQKKQTRSSEYCQLLEAIDIKQEKWKISLFTETTLFRKKHTKDEIKNCTIKKLDSLPPKIDIRATSVYRLPKRVNRND